MECIDQVDALVIRIDAADVTWKLVGAVEDDKARIRQKADAVEDRG